MLVDFVSKLINTLFSRIKSSPIVKAFLIWQQHTTKSKKRADKLCSNSSSFIHTDVIELLDDSEYEDCFSDEESLEEGSSIVLYTSSHDECFNPVTLQSENEESLDNSREVHPTSVEISSASFTTLPKQYSTSCKVLSFEQCDRLNSVMRDKVTIHGRGTFPNIEMELCTFVQVLKDMLELEEEVNLNGIRLNGSVAGYVVGSRVNELGCNDIDLIFCVNLSTDAHLVKIQEAVFDALRHLLSISNPSETFNATVMNEAFIQKFVKIQNEDNIWTLISLFNDEGRNVELKFVDKMKRQYEFSVDSFQVELDSLLHFYNAIGMELDKSFYPSVLASSVYGRFDEALYHLNNRLISTRRPEEIRGGGLLKYCNLLTNSYVPANSEIRALEKYMCSRFFIDFPEVGQQQAKLHKYLTTHFPHDIAKRAIYLNVLKKVIDSSTVCLMNMERMCTLNLIDSMAAEIVANNIQFQYSTLQPAFLEPDDCQQDLPKLNNSNGSRPPKSPVFYPRGNCTTKNLLPNGAHKRYMNQARRDYFTYSQDYFDPNIIPAQCY